MQGIQKKSSFIKYVSLASPVSLLILFFNFQHITPPKTFDIPRTKGIIFLNSVKFSGRIPSEPYLPNGTCGSDACGSYMDGGGFGPD